MEQYYSIKKDAVVNLEEKKSKFIGSIFKIDTEDNAKEILTDIRKKYNDATHNCYGFITLDGKIKRCSDDGEPQKTAGVPILDVIEKNNLVGVLIVVTRYYGGTLLGTGGLVKMYSGSAVASVKEAEIALFIPYNIYEVTIDYNLKAKMEFLFEKENFTIIDEQYSDKVTVQVQMRKEQESDLTKIMTDLTNQAYTPVLVKEDIMLASQN